MSDHDSTTPPAENTSIFLLLTAAFAYTARGWRVIPCYTPTDAGCSCGDPGCKDKDIGKHPHIEGWRNEATTDEAQIREWWAKWPDANIGIVTGKVSGLVVLDRDDYDGGAESLKALEHTHDPLPETARVISGGGGRHYFFAHPGTRVYNSNKKIGRGLDIKGDGGLVIAPPSLHKNGKQYQWEFAHEPDDIPLAPMPDWLRVLTENAPRQTKTRTVVQQPENLDQDTILSALWSIPDVGDHDCWREIGMALHSTGASWAKDEWDRWSQQSPKYKEADQRKRWRSFHQDGGITISTLFRRAHEAGWRQSQDLDQRRNADTSSSGNPNVQDTRRVIRISTDVAGMVNSAIEAVLHLPHAPQVYQRARAICAIAQQGTPPKWLRRQANAPIIQTASVHHLWELLTIAALWEKWDERHEEWKPATPPRWVVEVLQGRTRWPFPLLEGLVCSPTLRPDGSILDQPGYDPSTGLYLDFGGTTFPTVPASPTLDDAHKALRKLIEVFQDFPFAARKPSSGGTTYPYWSATLAAVLTLVGRSAITGNIPLFAVTATAAASGKGKLVDAISIIGTGRHAPKMSQTLDNDEELKRLLALALEGASVCCIDNVAHPLGNQHLDMALTTQAIKGRILGQTQMVEGPWNAVLFATGNNLRYQGDTGRRVVPIALDPKMEKPEERSGFIHPNLESWVMQERPRLAIYALTILRAYFVAGCPSQSLSPWGSFETWSDLIRNAVVWLGEPDPCEGRQDLAEQTDETYERLSALLAAWEAFYPFGEDGTAPTKTLNHVKQEVEFHAASTGQSLTKGDLLREALTQFDKRSDGKTLNTHLIGNALRTIEGRVIAGKRLTRCGQESKVALWRLERV